MEFLAILGVLYGVFLLLVPVLLFVVFSRLRRLEAQVTALKNARLATPPSAKLDQDRFQHDRQVDASAASSNVTSPVTVHPAAPPGPSTAKPNTSTTAHQSAPGAIPILLPEIRLKAVSTWLLGGNTVARVGVIVLFFGVAFLLKYTAQQGLFSIELRLLAVGLGAIALLITGLRLQSRRRNYGLVLQGGAIGIIYTTLFATVDRYGLISPALGLTLMVVTVVLTSVFAVFNNARSLAILATVGGLLAPVLITRGAHHLFMFCYYGVFNAGVVALAWFKAWRELVLLGFIFTWVIAALWLYYHYRSALFPSTEAFLILFFLLYVAAPIFQPQPPPPKNYRYTLPIFAVPLAVFGLQAKLVEDFAYGSALSAMAMSVFYWLVAFVLRRHERRRDTTDAFLATAVVFATLAIPLLVDGRWTGAAWTLEGAALVWVGVRQKQLPARLFGLAVQFAAGVAFLLAFAKPTAATAVLNSVYMGGLLLSLGGLVSASLLFQIRDPLTRYERHTPSVALTWGLGWWFGTGLSEIWRHVAHADLVGAVLLFLAASCAAMAFLSHRLSWRQIGGPTLVLLPSMTLLAIALTIEQGDTHPLAGWRLPGWIAAFAVQYRLLWLFEKRWPDSVLRLNHQGALWLGTFLLTWELAWWVAQVMTVNSTWSYCSWGLTPSVIVLGLLIWRPTLNWPVQRFQDSYLNTGLAPLVVFLSLWTLHASVQLGDPQPLAYRPLLNPLELVQLVGLLALSKWLRTTTTQLSPQVRWYSWAALAFIALNATIARATHFWGNIPYELGVLLQSALFQAAISITWTVLALVTMIAATRHKHRIAWLTGGLLLGGVVLKLFTVDLSGVATLARIVSFLAVGLVLLVIGYVSPLPPQAEQE